MKKISTLLIMLCMVSTSFAKILTVSNNPQIQAQYTDMNEAILAAAAGDTLYVHGSETFYGDITINKKLTIIGSGYLPDNQINLVSKFNTINLEHAAEGSQILGVEASSIQPVFATAAPVNDITIKRCRLNVLGAQTASRMSNWVIANNLIGMLYYIKSNNLLITNNVIRMLRDNSVEYSYNILISNNIFVHGSELRVKNAIIANNIFYCTYNISHTAFSVFSHNIQYHNPEAPNYKPIDAEIPSGNNTGSGNLVNVDPLVADLTDWHHGGHISLKNDYTLAEGSPAKNAGSDGTDIGISGGGFPFHVHEGGVLFIPQVKSFDLLNSYIPENGKLHFKSKATISN